MNNNQKFSEDFINTIKRLDQKYDGRIIFCGSFGLVLNNLIDREIHDIDCFTLDNHYGNMSISMDEHNFGSGHFLVNGKEIFRFSEKINNYDIDIMYREDSNNIIYDIIDFYGTSIKVENSNSAIIAKEQYLESNKNHINKDKHTNDLNEIRKKLALYETDDDLPF